MDEKMENKIVETLAWMAFHEEEVSKIIDADVELSYLDCLNIVTELERDKQYELILAFLHAGRFTDPVASIGNDFWLKLAVEGWRTIGTVSAIKQLKEIIKDQLQRENGLRYCK